MSDNGKLLRKDLKQPLLTGGTYDFLKRVVQIGFPAAIVLYTALAGYWGWQNTEQIVGSAGAIVIFLGVVLEISSSRYKKLPSPSDGEVVINDTDPEKDVIRLEIDQTWSELADKGQIVLNVVNPLKDNSQL